VIVGNAGGPGPDNIPGLLGYPGGVALLGVGAHMPRKTGVVAHALHTPCEIPDPGQETAAYPEERSRINAPAVRLVQRGVW
jgi:hypothetical protein